MDSPKTDLLKRLVVISAIAMLFYMPTREFLKTTLIVGVPFIFILGYMVRQKKYSLKWVISLVLIVSLLGGYGYLLLDLPERIATRKIISEGGVLVAGGKYDAAIEKYQELDKLGKKDKMNKMIEEVEREKEASDLYNQATELIESGDTTGAKKVLDSIPKNAQISKKAAKLKDSLD